MGTPVAPAQPETLQPVRAKGPYVLEAPDLLQSVGAAVYLTDAAGRITFYNEAAVELWGHRPQIGTDSWCGSWRLFWPDGRPMAHDECPMAVALKEGRAIRGAEAIAERPDGTRVPFLAFPTPLHDENGRLVGAANTLIDLSARQRGDELAHRLAAIVESSFDAIIGIDREGVIGSWNEAAERLYGYSAEEAIGRPVMILIPPELEDDERSILARVRRGERVEHYETVRMRKDGSRVDIALSVSPIRDSAGNVIGASKIAHDNTERKLAAERQSLLLREMNHRVKNVFALSGGLVTLSARSAETPNALAAEVRDRLAALARAHDLTLPALGAASPADAATDLAALLRTILSPYTEHDGDRRIVLDGPEVGISGAAVTSLALLLHEFATNSAKHGALVDEAGRLRVSWRTDAGALDLLWEEACGRPIAGGERREGFGSLLSRGTIERQLGGEMTREWRDDGLAITLRVPLSRLAD